MSFDRNSDVSGKSLLIVDDMTPTRELLKSLLLRAGYREVFTAVDGADALRILNLHYIDLVISDWVMPKMGGLQLLKRIRNSNDFRDILFLMVTNLSEKENVMQAVQFHVDGYIVKPFSPQILLKQVSETFSHQTRFNSNSKVTPFTKHSIKKHLSF